MTEKIRVLVFQGSEEAKDKVLKLLPEEKFITDATTHPGDLLNIVIKNMDHIPDYDLLICSKRAPAKYSTRQGDKNTIGTAVARNFRDVRNKATIIGMVDDGQMGKFRDVADYVVANYRGLSQALNHYLEEQNVKN